MKKHIAVAFAMGVFCASAWADGAGRIGRPVRILSLGFKNQPLDRICNLVDKEAAQGVDLVILPEVWRGLDDHSMETLDGPATQAMSALARKHHTYIASPIDRTDGSHRWNSVVLLDREGNVAFIYNKAFPYWSEFDFQKKIEIGRSAPVFQADFGKVGFAICFDVNFPEVWKSLADNGAELVVFPTAYSAGTAIQAHALTHHYYIVSATGARDCTVYDITGKEILYQKSDDINVTHVTLDLDRRIFHTNFNLPKRDKLLREHSADVEQTEFLEREAWFVLQARRPGVSALQLSRQYGLEELRAYIDRSRRSIDAMRGSPFGAQVDIHPGADIPSLVASNPAGTAFIIYPGTYRLTQPVIPKTGDGFIGRIACTPAAAQCSAVINGGTEIGSSATADGPDWKVTGQMQQGRVNSYSCDPGWDGCNYPEDLFYDGVPQKHVKAATRPTLASGEWWFDYPNHVIYFHDSPSGHSVETGIVPTLFGASGANNVIVRNLTIKEFASPTIAGAIDPAFGSNANPNTSINWTIENCYITLNHGEAVRAAFGEQILGSVLDTNGQFGTGGGAAAGSNITPSGILVQGNTVTHNNYAHVNPGFGAGGMKWGNAANVTVKNNVVKNNFGSGIHFDDDSINPLVDGNIVTDNADPAAAASSTGDGIRFEISLVGAIYRNNIVQRNGVGGAGPGYQIDSADSAGTQIYCNVVEVNQDPHEQGISAFASNRGNNRLQPFLGQQLVSINNSIHHNTVIWDAGAASLVGYMQNDAANQPDFFASNTPPDFNTYHLPSLSATDFEYDNNNSGKNTRKTFAQYQAAGADVHGSADTNNTSGFPTVAIASPADQSTFANSVMLSATASDPSGIGKVEFYVDWNLQATVTSAPYNFNWTHGASGSHTVAAMAYSNAGIRACYAVTLNAQ